MTINKKPPKKDTAISLRMSTDDKGDIKKAADKINLSSCEYILTAVVEKMENDNVAKTSKNS